MSFAQVRKRWIDRCGRVIKLCWGPLCQFYNLQMTNTYYNFRVDTDLACVDYHRHLQSAPEQPGWRISIFLIFIFIIYFVIGIVYNVAVKKRRGCGCCPTRLLDERAQLHVVGGESVELGDQQPTGRGFPTENWKLKTGTGTYEQISDKSLLFIYIPAPSASLSSFYKIYWTSL